jgi:hypothetical protein
MAVSPTVEGFRAAFRRPSLTLAEIAWRWVVGATALTLFFFGLFEYLDTLPVTDGELLLLRTRQPYLVWQAIAHMLRGSLNRVVLSWILAGLMLSLLWIIAASVGRIATVRAMLEYFRRDVFGNVSAEGAPDTAQNNAGNTTSTNPIVLFRINFLRVALIMAALVGFVGAAILASFVSPDSDPQPGLVFLVFLPFAALICFITWTLNWLLSLAGVFAVRDGEDAVGSISAAVALCRERMGAVFAVSTWTGMAHIIAFVVASTVASTLVGLASLLPWRLVVLGVAFVTLVYFALADWLYTARLAGYVCIIETPDVVPVPQLPTPTAPPVQTAIDRNETILSDLPGLAVET